MQRFDVETPRLTLSVDQLGGSGPEIRLPCAASALRLVKEAQDPGKDPLKSFSITWSSSRPRELIAWCVRQGC